MALCLFLLLGVGCATPPPVAIISREEMLQKDRALGAELAQHFESQLKFKQDTEVSVYLRQTAQNLMNATPELRGSAVGVWLIRSKGRKWRSYSLPGNRIYLPTEVLRALDFENEVAALIAVELAHLLKKHVLERLKADSAWMGSDNSSAAEFSVFERSVLQKPQEWFHRLHYDGPDGIFSFSEEAQIAAMQMAVKILYSAGYDSRGLISLCSRFQAEPNRSPYEESTLKRLVEQIRREIAFTTPLRNPVVRSYQFLRIQKRIQKL